MDARRFPIAAGPDTDRGADGEVGRSGEDGGREMDMGVREGVVGGLEALDIVPWIARISECRLW